MTLSSFEEEAPSLKLSSVLKALSATRASLSLVACKLKVFQMLLLWHGLTCFYTSGSRYE